jgi:molecular chaperone DnaK
MYKAQQAEGSAQPGEAPGAGPAGGGTGPNGDRVVDAEFEEIDDKKKSS